MNRKVLVLVFLSLLLGVVGFYYQRYKLAPTIELPAIELTDLNGQSVPMAMYSGKPLFISFFATWCGPCRRELPELAVMHRLLSLNIIAVSDEPIEKLKEIQPQLGLDVVILHSIKPLHDIGIYTFPTNYIFNREGKRVYAQTKPEDWTDATVVEQVRKIMQ